MKKYILFLLVGGLLTSCVASRFLEDDIVIQHGTKVFNANYEKLMNSISSVLETEGYDIANVNMDKGTIKSKQKMVGATGNGAGYAVGLYRQYTVKVTKISEDNYKVILQPRVFQGNLDISDRKVWVIDGEAGEIALWQSLFKKIKENL